jgi:hypothetical protein
MFDDARNLDWARIMTAPREFCTMLPKVLPNDNFTKRSCTKKIHNSLIYLAVPRGVEPPTFGLGNRFDPHLVNDLRPDVADVLHLFPHRAIPQHIFAHVGDLPARCPLLSNSGQIVVVSRLSAKCH